MPDYWDDISWEDTPRRSRPRDPGPGRGNGDRASDRAGDPDRRGSEPGRRDGGTARREPRRIGRDGASGGGPAREDARPGGAGGDAHGDGRRRDTDSDARGTGRHQPVRRSSRHHQPDHPKAHRSDRRRAVGKIDGLAAKTPEAPASRGPGYFSPPEPGGKAGRPRTRAPYNHTAPKRAGTMQTYDYSSRHHVYRRKGSPLRPILLGVLILLAVVGVGAFVFTRPAALTVRVIPEDARIEVTALAGAQGSDVSANEATIEPATGSLDAKGLAPGRYTVKVTRTGYRVDERTVDLRRGRRTKLDIKLNALPVPLTFSLHPSSAAFTLTLPDGTTRSGTGAFNGVLPGGEATIVASAKGYGTLQRVVSLGSAQSLQLWLDPPGQLVHSLGVFDCGPAPKGLQFSPDGRQVWVAMLGGPPSVEVYDPMSGKKLGSVALGTHGAVEVCFSADGTRAYASQMETARVYEIDTKTLKVKRTLDTKSAWSKVVMVSRDGSKLFVANWSGDDVSEIDLGSGKTVRRLRTVDTPRGLYETADGRYLYVAGFGKGELDRIDLKDGSRKTLFKSGGALRHLVGDDASGRLYASDMAKDRVWVTDLASGETRTFAKTDHKPNTIDLSPDGKVLFVSNRGANNEKSYYLPGSEWGSVLLLDTVSGKTLDAIVGGNQCTALDASSDGRLLVFSDFLDNRLRIYEVPSHKRLAAGGGGRAKTHLQDLKKKNGERAPGTTPSSSAVAN